jgi:hypothetical protein
MGRSGDLEVAGLLFVVCCTPPLACRASVQRPPTGTVLYINPFIGDAPGSSQQLEAQERCGASLAEIYQQQVIEGDQP